eukprot:12899470-Prorocentrum_lima.AAC.1
MNHCILHPIACVLYPEGKQTPMVVPIQENKLLTKGFTKPNNSTGGGAAHCYSQVQRVRKGFQFQEA